MDKYTQPQWKSSALITIDVQEDFSRKKAPAYIPGTEDILPSLSRLLTYFRTHSRPVIHIIRLYKKDGSNVDICRRAIIKEGMQLARPESKGAELVQELKPHKSTRLNHDQLLRGNPQKADENEWILYKPRWGAFYQTSLEEILRNLGVTTVAITGCNFPNCPRTTIYEASERDFRIVLVKDCVSGSYDRGFQELENIGVVLINSNKIIDNNLLNR